MKLKQPFLVTKGFPHWVAEWDSFMNWWRFERNGSDGIIMRDDRLVSDQQRVAASASESGEQNPKKGADIFGELDREEEDESIADNHTQYNR